MEERGGHIEPLPPKSSLNVLEGTDGDFAPITPKHRCFSLSNSQASQALACTVLMCLIRIELCSSEALRLLNTHLRRN